MTELPRRRLDLGKNRTSPTSAARDKSNWGGPRARWRPAARGVRRLRHIRASRCGRHHRARPACAPAPRPGGRRHRLLRRQALPFRAADGPRRRQFLAARGDRAAARHVGDRTCALFDHRRDLLRNVQPLFAELDGGGFAVGHNGNLTNGLTLRRQLVRDGALMQSTTDTEVILHLVAAPNAIASSIASSKGCASSKAPMRLSGLPTRSSSAHAIRSAFAPW